MNLFRKRINKAHLIFLIKNSFFVKLFLNCLRKYSSKVFKGTPIKYNEIQLIN